MKLYRVEVDHWPTEDGQPWDRYYVINELESIPTWLRPIILDGELPERERGSDHDPYGVNGFVCPKPRRTWLSRHAAERWVRDATVLGAKCRLLEADVSDFREVSLVLG